MGSDCITMALKPEKKTPNHGTSWNFDGSLDGFRNVSENFPHHTLTLWPARRRRSGGAGAGADCSWWFVVTWRRLFWEKISKGHVFSKDLTISFVSSGLYSKFWTLKSWLLQMGSSLN